MPVSNKEIFTVGSMDLDNDVSVIKDGYYRYARNITQLRDELGNAFRTKATLGNEFAINIGSVTSQNKRYRVYLPLGFGADMRIRIYHPNGGTHLFDWTFFSFPQSGNAVAQAWATTAQSYFISLGGETISTTVGTGYVDFEYTTHPLFDYDLVITDAPTGKSPYDHIVIRECIGKELEGQLVPIMSYDLAGDLYIWSTTQRKDSEQLSVTVTNVSPTSSGSYVGPITTIAVDAPHGLSVGERIRITHSEHFWLNGYFTVQSVPNATSFTIITELYSGASVPVGSATGSERIFRDPEGIGEIGVFKEDVDAETFTYTRLIRSKELNLRTVWTMDRPTVEKNGYRLSFYFNDSRNPPRAMYYVNEHVVDGFLGHVNGSDGMYFYGHINTPTTLIQPQSKAWLDFSQQLNDGGNLSVGNKRYVIRLLNRFLVPTEWSAPSSTVPVYAPKNGSGGVTPNNRVFGSVAGTMTGKINVLEAKDVDRYAYEFMEIGVIEYASDDSQEGKVLYRIPTRIGDIGSVVQYSPDIRHTGYEDSYALDLTDLTDLSSELLDRADNMSPLDNRMILSAVSRDEEDDLTAWARTWQHRIMRHAMNASLNDSASFSAIGEYEDVDNCFRYVGYMDNENYRFAFQLRNRETGKWTKAYHIDDLRFDPNTTNLGKYDDDRRDQTGPVSGSEFLKTDWALTQETSGSDISPDTGTDYRVFATYFELFGGDMRTLVGGVPIRQKYDRIRVVRPDTNPSILCTGMSVMGVAAYNPTMLDWTEYPDGTENRDLSGSNPYARSKTLWRGNYAKSIHEFPLFTSYFNNALNSNQDRFIEHNYPNNAFVGLGFGETVCNMSSSVWFDSLIAGGNKKNPLIAFPNINSFYSPDILTGKISQHSVEEGRYSLRHMGNNDSAVRLLGQNTTKWGRSRSSFCELHPFAVPFNPLSTMWNDYDLIRAEYVTHGGEVEADQFEYTQFAQVISSSPSASPFSSDLYSNALYRRSYDAVNLASGQTWGTAGSTIGGGADQSIDSLWVNSPCMMLQTGHLSGQYPKISFNHAVTMHNPNSVYYRNFNIGTFYAQLVREMVSPYGNPENTVYRNICAEFEITRADGIIQKLDYPIFGGDTFTQGTYILNRMANETWRTDATTDWHSMFDGCDADNRGVGNDARAGWGSGFKMYSQNRINSHFRYSSDDQFLYQADTVDKTLWTEGTDAKRDLYLYNSGFTPALNTNVFAPFVKSLPTRSAYDARILWSDRNAQDALTDNYRSFPFLNNTDLNLTNGKITWHKALNGELVTWQREDFQRQFFNASGQLQVSPDMNVNIGDGSVLSRKGVTLSTYGCSDRESIIYGKSEGGKDVAYWFNSRTWQFLRFGADGTVVISDRQPIYAWVRDNAKWAIGESSPYELYGIRGVWDEAYKEVIWTFTGRRNALTWQSAGVNYSVGDIVVNQNTPNGNFHDLEDIYVCTRTHTSSASTEPNVGASWTDFWELADHTDNKYYTEFSIAWNEKKNGFSCFYGIMPRIYLPFKDSFVTTHPSQPSNLYVHRRGERLKWWELNGTSFTDDAYIDLVLNEIPNEEKRFYAIEVSSDLPPQYTEFFTPSQTSYLDEAEWEAFLGRFQSPIKNDSTATGLNSDDADMLFGRYLIVRMYILNPSENGILSCSVKYNYTPRTIKR